MPGCEIPALRSVGNERGMALILALLMLTLLGILGIWALDTSTTDLKIAGNFRSNQYAFYAADAGVGYVTNANMLLAVYNFAYGSPGWTSGNVSVDVSTSSTCSASVPTIFRGPLPQGGGASVIYDADIGSSGWHGVYTAVTSAGSAVNHSTAVIDAVVVQAVPN